MITIPANDKGIVDASRRRLTKCDNIRPSTSPEGIWPISLNFDYNLLPSLDGLDAFSDVTHLSAAHNEISRIGGINRLSKLSVLNINNNCLTNFDGLRTISSTLTWLNVSNNNIKTFSQLQYCTLIVHLDLSYNHIEALSDISCLKGLQRILLHGNKISSLRNAPNCLPKSIATLSLDENYLTDLNNISFLSQFGNLENLSIMNNECVQSGQFDYRSFIVNWCLNVRILDGKTVTERENLLAEWLYSQGKGRHFHVGQHEELVNYLMTACPIEPRSSIDNQVRLSKVLQQQRLHQRELEESISSVSTIKSNSPPKDAPEPTLSNNLPPWASISGCRPSLNDQPHRMSDDMKLQDVTSDDAMSSTQLEGESRYLPLSTEMEFTPLKPFDVKSILITSSDQEANYEKCHDSNLFSKTFHDSCMPNTDIHVNVVQTTVTKTKPESTCNDFMQLSTSSCPSDSEKPRTRRKRSSKNEKQEKAAIKIQALIRGYLARNTNKQVVKIRQEIRSRRSEDHIIYLEHNQNLTDSTNKLQSNLIEQLTKKVNDLNDWKASISQSFDINNSSSINFPESTHGCDSQASTLVCRLDDMAKKMNDMQFEMDNLKNIVLKYELSSTLPQKSKNLESKKPKVCASLDYANSSSKVLLPPCKLNVLKETSTTATLKWDEIDCNDNSLFGYRIYIGEFSANSNENRILFSKVNKVEITSLNDMTTYRAFVTSLTEYGESQPSNIVLIHESALNKNRFKSVSSSTSSSSSDKDRKNDFENLDDNTFFDSKTKDNVFTAKSPPSSPSDKTNFKSVQNDNCNDSGFLSTSSVNDNKRRKQMPTEPGDIIPTTGPNRSAVEQVQTSVPFKTYNENVNISGNFRASSPVVKLQKLKQQMEKFNLQPPTTPTKTEGEPQKTRSRRSDDSPSRKPIMSTDDWRKAKKAESGETSTIENEQITCGKKRSNSARPDSKLQVPVPPSGNSPPKLRPRSASLDNKRRLKNYDEVETNPTEIKNEDPIKINILNTETDIAVAEKRSSRSKSRSASLTKIVNSEKWKNDIAKEVYSRRKKHNSESEDKLPPKSVPSKCRDNEQPLKRTGSLNEEQLRKFRKQITLENEEHDQEHHDQHHSPRIGTHTSLNTNAFAKNSKLRLSAKGLQIYSSIRSMLSNSNINNS